MKKFAVIIAFSAVLTSLLQAEIKLPGIIGDRMVLQQQQADPIWGWDEPGTKITVSFAGQEYSTTAGADGKWMVKLAPLPADAKPQTLTVSGTTQRIIQDVLIGEVWMCSGQSNMNFPLTNAWNGDLEIAAASVPDLRLIAVPRVGTQELQNTFKGAWQISNPATASRFTAVGFLFGRYLHQILHVPVGLINNAWGGSEAEAWVRRSSLEQDPHFKAMLDWTTTKEAELESSSGRSNFDRSMEEWKAEYNKAKAEGSPPPNPPENWLTGQHRPGNVFAGTLYPTLGYGIKGVIWYQGESNIGRVDEYAYLFRYLIQQWRKEWGQGDFPFYWVQLPNYEAVNPMLCAGDWALLREAQTEALKLPNTGQAVTFDLGEGNNLHPKDKADVALRLVRWPLARDYGLKLSYRSPEFDSFVISGRKVRVTFDCFGSSLRPFGNTEARGFALCGADHVWYPATGNIIATNAVEVSSPEVAVPAAVRYAWANNPVCNLYSSDGLPVTPFRADDFK